MEEEGAGGLEGACGKDGGRLSVASWHKFIMGRLRLLCPADGSPFWMAEIGVASGGTSALCLRDFPSLRLWMIDPWWTDPDYLRESGHVLRRPDGGLMNQGDFDAMAETARCATEFAAARRVILRMPSWEAAGSIPDGQLSLVFIDGDHGEAAVRKDCRLYWPKVKPGGVFSGHDYGNRKHPGVKLAVDEWAVERGIELRREPGARGIWYVPKGPAQEGRTAEMSGEGKP